MAALKLGDVCRNLYLLFTYLCVPSERSSLNRAASFPGMQLSFPQSHNAQRLFGPVHTGKERVGFDVIHASHACPQSLHWVVLEQLLQQRSGLL